VGWAASCGRRPRSTCAARAARAADDVADRGGRRRHVSDPVRCSASCALIALHEAGRLRARSRGTGGVRMSLRDRRVVQTTEVGWRSAYARRPPSESATSIGVRGGDAPSPRAPRQPAGRPRTRTGRLTRLRLFVSVDTIPRPRARRGLQHRLGACACAPLEAASRVAAKPGRARRPTPVCVFPTCRCRCT